MQAWTTRRRISTCPCQCLVGLDFVFHMFFLIKYSKSLEEGSFRGRSADFLWMLLIGQSCLYWNDHASHQQIPVLTEATMYYSAGGTLLTCCAPFVNIQFLGSSLTFMMVSDNMLAPRMVTALQI